MSRKSRTKGAAFEREVAKLFQRWWPDAKRGLVQTRNSFEAPDVTGTPYWIECKRWKKCNIAKAIEQAETESRAHYVTYGVFMEYIVVTRDDRRPIMVTTGPMLSHRLYGMAEQTTTTWRVFEGAMDGFQDKK